MRLKHISIKGFRGFPQQIDVDLEADATVVIGANGMGKTTLLDAVHWAICGQIPRIVNSNDVVSLYSETGEARVELELVGDAGNNIVIQRRMSSEKQLVHVRSGGVEKKGSAAIALILERLWPDAIGAKEESSVLSQTLERSVYLQQDKVQDFVESSSDVGRFNAVCELVGTGRVTEMLSQLESESRSWSLATTRQEKDLEPLRKKHADQQDRVERLKATAAVGGARTEDFEAWWNDIATVVPSTRSPKNAASPNAMKSVSDMLIALETKRSSLSRSASQLSRMAELLGDEPENPADNLQELDKRTEGLKASLRSIREALKSARLTAAQNRASQIALREANAQRKALAEIALKLLSDTCPVCQQTYDEQETREYLSSLLREPGEGTNPETNDPTIDELLKAEESATALLTESESNLKKAKDDHRRLENWRQEVEALAKTLSIDGPPSRNRVVELIHENNELKTKVDSLSKRGEELSVGLASEAAKVTLRQAEEEFLKMKAELADVENSIRRRVKATNTAKKVIQRLRTANTELAIAKLNEIEPFLQRIYSRIDPHPSFRAVSFVGKMAHGKGRLNPEVSDRIAGVSCERPVAVLSSSQLNALAVSIFLSFNLTIPRIPLKVALLDDPIQSLDDINLLGLVDLLRRVKANRQVVVTTHDARFGELLARKLRPGSGDESTSVVTLTGWGRYGPEISQSRVAPDDVPLKLVATG